jgi:hypothetical protein
MNDHAPSDPLRVKAFALCAHLEKLCATGVLLLRSRDLKAFDALEARKSIILLELVRILKLPALSEFPDIVRSIVDRAGIALRAELAAVTTAAGEIGMKLSLIRARAQELSKLRGSYGSSDFSGQPGGRGPRSTIIARG